MAIFENKSIVDISKVDSNSFITNKGMLELLETAACFHSDTAGYGIKDIPSTNLSWVQLNWKVKIFRRLRYGEEVTVKTWARSSTKVSTLRDFEVLDSNNKPVCIATTRWTLINIDTLSITKITDDIIEKYNPEEKTVLPDFQFKKLIEPHSYSNKYVYTTQRRDIDVNKHMHNLNYLDLAYEALHEDIYNQTLKNNFNNIEIMYKTSIRLGDTSKCLYTFENDKHIITIKSLDDKALHCIINLW